jgi:ribosomal protein S18 acetylase RimI-like enzyme
VSEAFEIRLAAPEEYDEVGEITVRGYAHDGFLESSDAYASSLRDASSRAVNAELWVAADISSRRLLGSVTFCPLGSPYRELATEAEGEFRMLAVDPQARGHGVGKALVRHCLDHSRDLGFGSVVLCSLPTMTAAHALYLSQGFTRDRSLDWSPIPGLELWGFRTGRPPENPA